MICGIRITVCDFCLRGFCLSPVRCSAQSSCDGPTLCSRLVRPYLECVVVRPLQKGETTLEPQHLASIRPIPWPAKRGQGELIAPSSGDTGAFDGQQTGMLLTATNKCGSKRLGGKCSLVKVDSVCVGKHRYCMF